ncbi:hypothetical protein ASF48_00675 [Rathayibacter sp. Leaf299]|uniref:hypothetical protein n=1 Tax=Rathayibacter sp. Leaf299 TaxID=1736328 RepID=UPI0006F6385A|nr:hypothetical protein [Rathayibacter sp. Leaf299]KQQ21802.1 hypothetical protein ASF48_00675 [Rathayibacter sp. Leaf299]
MAITETAPRGTARLVLALVAFASGVLLLSHAAVQGVGALSFWQPCWMQGYDSGACAYLQYEAPTPEWLAPLWVWFAELLLSIAVLALSMRAQGRIVPAAFALLAVLGSSILVDYVFTPAVNGGYLSADNPPGFGLIGAVCQAVAGVLLLVTAVPPRR